MKQQTEIEQDLIQKFLSLQDKVTAFVMGSVIRGIFVSLAISIGEAWHDLTQNQRKLFFDTAKGTDLDRLAEESGLTRLGATSATAILVFNADVETGTSTSVGTNFLTDTTKSWTVDDFINGTWILHDAGGTEFTVTANTSNTISVVWTPVACVYYIMPKVPSGTVVKSSVSSVGYATQEDVIVGKRNPALLGQSQSISLGNRTLAVADRSGNAGSSPANAINLLSPTINGVTSVTNPVPTQPRTSLDAESDDQLRERCRGAVNLLNEGTQAFYERLAMQADANVMRAIARKDSSTDGVKVFLASRNGAAFTGGQLATIKAFIEARQRAFDTATAVNMDMTDIFVSFTTVLMPGATLVGAYVKAADAIGNFLDYATWLVETKVVDDDILAELKKLAELKDIDLATFSVTATKAGNPAGSGTITLSDSLPRFARLKITNQETAEVKDLVLEQLAVRLAEDNEFINQATT